MTSGRQGQYKGKRALDLVLLGCLAAPAGVVGAGCAVAIRLTSPGPVLFRQRRAGRNGQEFTLLKFRTMVHAPEGNPVFPDASLITPVGRWLRRFSLDELPQLVNVARGDMTFVGPRPTLPYQVARYDAVQRRRLDVAPGVTGLAQVRGRNAISWAERIVYDLQYVDRQSPWLDLRILWWSLASVWRGSGVEGHPLDDPLATPDP